MPCVLLWAPRFPRFHYIMKLKRNEKCYLEDVVSKEYLVIVIDSM
jgi:hypothetical protein